jgi:hypothetical protein
MSDALSRTATAADAERCLAVLALAFGSDPPCRWAGCDRSIPTLLCRQWLLLRELAGVAAYNWKRF